jgi:hypothetical protein
MTDYWYLVRYSDEYQHKLRKTLKDARNEACSMILENKRKTVFIYKNSETGRSTYIGKVRFDYTKDKYGSAYGPTYITANRKVYLLDFDGSIFDKATGKKVRKQSKGAEWHPFGL